MTPTYARQASASPPGISLLAARSRHALVAGLTFLEKSADKTLDLAALDAWLQRYLVGTGCMPWPRQVWERGVGSVPLAPDAISALDAATMCDAIVQEARTLVVITLRGFIASECDDRFLAGAIFRERVQRDSRGMMSAWLPRPHATDPLSEIVLSLFAADILGNRETYHHALGICRVCTRIVFDPTGADRPRCALHG